LLCFSRAAFPCTTMMRWLIVWSSLMAGPRAHTWWTCLIWVTGEQRIKGPLHVIRVGMHVRNARTAQLLVKQHQYAISRLTLTSVISSLCIPTTIPLSREARAAPSLWCSTGKVVVRTPHQH
jgi:hypothetical protein